MTHLLAGKKGGYKGLILLLLSSLCWSQTSPYPDQFHSIEGADSLLHEAVAVDGITFDDNEHGIRLQDDGLTGSIILNDRSSPVPFNLGLPSWNGTAPHDSTAFRIFIRFPQDSGSHNLLWGFSVLSGFFLTLQEDHGILIRMGALYS